MTDFISTDQIISAIVSGTRDDALDSISKAISARRKNINESKILFINIGDTVVFNSQASPKYLQGHTAIVSKVNEKTVAVDIPEDAYGARKWRGRKGVRCPIAIIDKVS